MPVVQTWSLVISVASSKLGDPDLLALSAARILQDTRAPGTFDLTFDAWDEDLQGFRLVDKVKLGAPVEIAVKDEKDRLYTIFAGELTDVARDVAGERGPLVHLRGYDVRHRLRRGRSTRAFQDAKDSDAAEKIAGELGVAIEVKGSPVTHEFLLQADQSDYDFLTQRAAAVGYELSVTDFGKKLRFRPLKVEGPAVAALDLEGSVVSFRGTCSILSQSDAVTVRGWDPLNKKELTGEAAASALPRAGGSASGPALAKSGLSAAATSRCDAAVANVSEAAELAKALLLRGALDHVEADVVHEGDPELVAGTIVEVKNAGTRFGSTYYVDNVSHVFTRDSNVYETHLKLRKLAS